MGGQKRLLGVTIMVTRVIATAFDTTVLIIEVGIGKMSHLRIPSWNQIVVVNIANGIAIGIGDKPIAREVGLSHRAQGTEQKHDHYSKSLFHTQQIYSFNVSKFHLYSIRFQ